MKKVIREERGWAGHFVCANRCEFKRNTLLTCGDVRIVVSTVGRMRDYLGTGYEEIGLGRYFETMAFHSDSKDTRWHDIDVSREVAFDSPWMIAEWDAEDKANKMHERVVKELIQKLREGEIR